MRILNIRLKNINSLHGEWFVDLEDPAYQTEGQFLITGPTGSGKTTLLDAICLALYGKTPRIQTISKDANELMSRHTAEALAEVQFETTAGRYLATWSQKKTRSNAKTPFQQAKRQLAEAGGNILCEKSTEMDARIKQLTGLDYKQFTQAVLLAQGGFAKFLKAEERDKAEILEKLTNTGQFSEISILAFEKAKAEKAIVDSLKAELDALQPLDPVKEAEMRSELEVLARRIRDLKDAENVCAENLRWLADIAALRKEAAELDSERIKLDAEEKAAVPQREALAAARRVAPLAIDYAELKNLDVRKREAAKKCADWQGKVQRLANEAADSQKVLEQAENGLKAAEREREAAEPMLAEARLLDDRRKAKIKEYEKANAEVRKCQELYEARAKRLNVQRAELAAAQQGRLLLEKWLAEHQADSWLVENLEALRGRLGNLAERKRRLQDADRKIKKSAQEIAKLEQQSQEAGKNRLAQEQNIAMLQKDLLGLAESRQNLLGGWELSGLRECLAEKRKTQLNAERIKTLEDRRRELAVGQPCPLCGALEHPYAAEQLPDPDQLAKECAALENRLAELDKLAEKETALGNKRHQAEMDLQLFDSQTGQIAASLEAAKRLKAEDASQAEEIRQEAQKLESAVREEICVLVTDCGNLDKVLPLLERRLADWRQNSEKLENIVKKVNELATLEAVSTAEAENAQRDLEQKKAVEEQIVNEGKQIREQRNGLLGGKEVVDVENNLRTRCDNAKKARDMAQNKHQSQVHSLKDAEGNLAAHNSQLEEVEKEREQRQKDFAIRLESLGISQDEFEKMRLPTDKIEQLQAMLDKLADQRTRWETRNGENSKNLDDLLARELTRKTAEELEQEKRDTAEATASAYKRQAELDTQLKASEEHRHRANELGERVRLQQKEYDRWEALNSLIGSKDGKAFRAFAQNVTLDILLEHANAQLAKIMDRYQLQRAVAARENLVLEVIDLYQGDEIRSIDNLSGGETFIVSLALALGLSSMAGSESSMGSLFLDEGFGSLDANTLMEALAAIRSLRHEGKLIGIISHVDALQDEIQPHIEIHPVADGRSIISGPGCKRVG